MLDPNMDMNQHPMDPHLQQVGAQGNNLCFDHLFSFLASRHKWTEDIWALITSWAPQEVPVIPMLDLVTRDLGASADLHKTCEFPSPDWSGGGHKDVG